MLASWNTSEIKLSFTGGMATYNTGMDKYRLLDQKEEIATMAKKAPVMEIGEIWQTLPFKRDIYRIKKLEVLTEALIFQTTLPFDFEPGFPIYIKINFKNLIFKLMPNEFRTYNNQLSCSFPKEAKAIESRALERTKLPKKSTIHLILRTISSESSLDIKVNIENVSETGLGLKASSLNRDYFERNSLFKIIKVCGRNHMEPCNLQVKHIADKDNKSFIYIGMESSLPLSSVFFDILREAMKKERFLSN